MEIFAEHPEVYAHLSAQHGGWFDHPGQIIEIEIEEEQDPARFRIGQIIELAGGMVGVVQGFGRDGNAQVAV